MTVTDTNFNEDGLARDIIIGALRDLFGSGVEDSVLIGELGAFIDSQITENKSEDEIWINIRQTSAWRQRFAGNEALRLAGLPELDAVSYLAAERQYAASLNSSGLGNLAKRDNFAALIGGNVSPVELEDRITDVYDRIRYADEALSAELQTLKSSGYLTDADLAESLLLGSEGTNVLKRKIAMAEITSEARRAGVTTSIGADELLAQGVSREQARAGYQRISEMLPAYTSAAERQRVNTGTLKKEIEGEALLGLRSQQRAKIAATEQASLAGASGTSRVSLNKQVAGSI
jgi:hypothetical protein